MEGTPEVELYICPKAGACKKDRSDCAHFEPHEYQDGCQLASEMPDGCPLCEKIGEKEIKIIKRWRERESQNI